MGRRAVASPSHIPPEDFSAEAPRGCVYGSRDFPAPPYMGNYSKCSKPITAKPFSGGWRFLLTQTLFYMLYDTFQFGQEKINNYKLNLIPHL